MFVCMSVAAALTAGVLKKLNLPPRLREWRALFCARSLLSFSVWNCFDIFFFGLARCVQVVIVIGFVCVIFI